MTEGEAAYLCGLFFFAVANQDEEWPTDLVKKFWYFLLFIAAIGCAKRSECPADMVRVPTQNKCVDKYESYVDEAGKAKNANGMLPRTSISWFDAQDACKQSGKRLCAYSEWLLACGGAEKLKFPYGATFDPEKCNTATWDTPRDEQKLRPAGSHAGCVSPSGAFDMSGNLSEWLMDTTNGGGTHLLVGGMYSIGEKEVACNRGRPMSQPPQNALKGVGIRCCLDLER